MRWWRDRSSRSEFESLLHRIRQLEQAIRRDRAGVIHKHTEDYMRFEEGGVGRAVDSLPAPPSLEPIPDGPIVFEYDPLDPEVLAAQKELVQRERENVPASVKRLLEKAEIARWGDLPLVKASGVSWRDTLTPRRVLVADGTQISNTTTETIMCPDFTFAADYFEHGDSFKYTLLFDHSTVITTPGTHTFRLRHGGVAGTSMAASGAFAPDPTAASTTVSEMLEFWFVVRSTGTAGSIFCMGRYTPNDFDDASAAAIVGNLNMLMIPTSAPAVTSSLDTTAAKAVSPTYTSSVNTATTQVTNHIAILESLN